MTNLIELTKCRAGFYYYFTATAQYLVKKEGNQWAFYKTVKGEIDGKALIVARTLALLKEAIINFVDSEIDTQDNEPKIEPQSHNQEISETTVTSEVEPVDSEIPELPLPAGLDRAYHLLRNTLFECDNKDCTIIESHFDQDSDILIVFGVQPFGDVKDNYCIWKYENYCTDLICVGKKEQLYRKYKNYCLTNNQSVDSEIDSNDNEPDGDDLHYPSEIDSPDPDFDHDTPEVDYPDYQALLGKFKEENPHFTILESKFFSVPYWHLTEQKLLIFGYGGDGNKFHCYSVISFTKTRTNHIFDGNYQQSRLIYQEYCENTANFKVYPPRQKDPILERYKQELTPDYRVFTRKQLALF